MQVKSLLSAVTATGAGAANLSVNGPQTYQATVAGTGAVTATVNIEVSNDASNWVVLGTITLSGTTSATDGLAANAPWKNVRANVTAISGTSAAVSVVMSA